MTEARAATETAFVYAAGARLEVRTFPAASSAASSATSSATSSTMVFLHEGLGSVSMWRDFPERVAKETGLATVVYSRRGYGASDLTAAPRDVRFMHDEAYEALPAVLDAAKVDDAILVGHSDGATIALLHAARFGPGRVRAVVALAPHLFVEDITVAQLTRTREAYRNGALRDKLARHHRDVDATFEGWINIWLTPEFRAWNVEAELAGLNVPMLVIQGYDDENGTMAQVDALVRLARSKVDVCRLERCGHSPHRDRPDAVLAAIASFVAVVTA